MRRGRTIVLAVTAALCLIAVIVLIRARNGAMPSPAEATQGTIQSPSEAAASESSDRHLEEPIRPSRESSAEPTKIGEGDKESPKQGRLPSGIRGTVVGPSGDSLSGAWVESLGSDRHVLSDIDGKFEYPTLRPDISYKLAIGFDGLVTSEIEVMPGRSVDVQLQKGTELQGLVYIDDEFSRRPAAGVVLTYTRSLKTLGHPCRVITNAQGAYRIVDLPGAELDIDVFACGAAPWSERVTLGSKSMVHDIVVRPPMDRINVHVLNCDTHQPIENAEVLWNRVKLARTDAQGNASLVLYAGQSRSITVIATGYGRRTKGFEPEQRVAGNEVTVELVPAASISGVVLDHAGDPLPNARVGLRTVRRGGLQRRVLPGVEGDWSQELLTDAQGRFELGGLASNERLCRFVVTASHPAHIRGESALIELTPGERGNPLTIQLRKGIKCSGIVTAQGQPVAAIVRVGSDGAAVFTDESGYYELLGLAAGQLELCAHLGGDPGVRVCRLVTIPSDGELWMPLEIAYSTEFISGTVTSSIGTAMADVEVRCSQPAFGDSSLVVYPARTNAAGEFHFEVRVASGSAPFDVGLNRWKSDCGERGVVPPRAVHLICDGSSAIEMSVNVSGTDIPASAYAVYWLARGKSVDVDPQVYCEDIRQTAAGKTLVVVPSGLGTVRISAAAYEPWTREVDLQPGESVDIGAVELELRRTR